MKRLITILFSFYLLSGFLYAAPDWQPEVYPGSGTTFYGFVTINGLPAEPSDLLGVFMEGECRAVGYPNAEGLIAGLTINGETGVSELLHFRFWDADNGVISDYFDLIPVTHAGENLSLDLEFFTPEIMDSQISVVGAEQVQGNSEFQVNLQSYQGVAQSWNINAIEFELHYDTSLVEFASYETAGCLTEGSLVEVSAQGSFVTVSITGEQFMGIDPLMKINFEALAGGGLCLIQLQNFWLEELPGNGYPIFNLLPAEITILPVNMPPVVANPISYLWLEENFETVEIDLSEVFLDPEGEELSYYVYNSFNIGYLEASIDGNFLYIASCPYISGVFQVTVTAEDPQGLIAIDEFYVYINPVNDPPEINLPAEFTFLYSQEVTQDFSNYIFDIDNDDLVLSSEGSDNIAVAINDFLVTLMPASGWTGSESLVFSVSDGMYTASDETLVTFETLPMELTADFYVENTQISLGSSVMFENQSIYPPEAVITYEWDFENDGITDSDEENPLYIYNEPGIYSVSLTIFDQYGNSDTELKENYLEVGEDNLPQITALNTDTAFPGDLIRVYGDNFGEINQDSGILIDSEFLPDIVTYWSPQEIHFHLPFQPEAGMLSVSIQKNAELVSNPLPLNLEIPQIVHFIYPAENELLRGDEVLISVTPEIRSELIEYTIFEYRPEGAADWIFIGEDTEGGGMNLSTYNEMEEGDGWSVIWNISDILEEIAEIRVVVVTVWDIELEGLRSVTIDQQHPKPWIDYHPWQESDIAGSQAIDEDSLIFEITQFDETVEFVELDIDILTALPGYHRDLEGCEQDWISATDSLGRDVSGMACGPAAAASCLKWLAEKHSISDLAGQNVLDLADDLCEESDTDSVSGTKIGNLIRGINNILDNTEGTSASDWEISGFHHSQPSVDPYNKMTSALYDSSDVILFVEQTDENGVKRGHAVTMGSHSVMSNYHFYEEIGCVYCERYMVDFMNPATGETEYYEVDRSADPPELIGYQLDSSNPQDNQPRIVGGLTIKPKDRLLPYRETITYNFPLNGCGDYRLAVNCRDLPVGILQAKLRCTNSEGISGETEIICVVEDYMLLPGFYAEPQSGTAPLQVQFINMSTPSDSIIAYEWDFEGLGTSVESDPLVTFSQPGTYSVTLTVTDVFGTTVSEYKEDYITVFEGNHAPELDLPDELFFDALGELELDLMDFASDPDDDELVFSYLADEILDISLNGSVASLTVPVSWLGYAEVIFFADDQHSRATACDTLTVLKTTDPFPHLNAVTDVPADQGGWVFVSFTASSLDTENLILRPTEHYTVEYLIDDVWTAANTATAYGAESYQVLVHTVMDSVPENPALFDFRVIAAMDEGSFASNIMPGCSVDNLSPQIPGGFVFDNNWLVWNEPVDSDFDHFNIYLNGDFLTHTIQPQLYLIGISGAFQVAAIDCHANQSELSQTITGGYPYGDIDHNLSVEAVDASLVLQYFCLLITDWENWQQIVADVDGNGAIEAYDASLIMQFVVGIINQFPIENISRNITEVSK